MAATSKATPVKTALKGALKAKRQKDAGVTPKHRPQYALAERIAEYEAVLPELWEALRDGKSVALVAKRHDMVPGNLRSYAWRNHRADYDAAQREGADILAERATAAAAEANEAMETIETTYADGSTTVAVKKFDNYQRSKLAADALWKLAAVKDPERYGAKAGQQEVSSLAGEIVAARKRIGAGAESGASGSAPAQ